MKATSMRTFISLSVLFLSLLLTTSALVAQEEPRHPALLEYMHEDTVGLILVEPHSLIHDTEQDVLGDVPYLGQFPIPPTDIEHAALFFKTKMGGKLSPTLVLQFRRDIPVATVRAWLLPGAKKVDHGSGLPFFEVDDSSASGLFGFSKLTFPDSRMAMLGGDDIESHLGSSNADTSRGELYRQAFQLYPRINFAALINVKELLLNVHTAPPFLTFPSLQQIRSLPRDLSVVSLEGAFGKQSNEMLLRLIPREGVTSTAAIEEWAAQPEEVVAGLLQSLSFYRNDTIPPELYEDLNQQFAEVAQFFGTFTTVDSEQGITMATENTPSVSRALSSASHLLNVGVLMARESARSVQLSNNYKQILLAWHNYESAAQRLPKDIFDGNGQPLLSWRVRILPQLGLQELYEKFKLDEPWHSEHNRQLITQMPAVYRDIRDKELISETRVQSVTGDGAILSDANKFGDVTDGLSNTAVLVEASAAMPWTRPADVPLQQDMFAQLQKHGNQVIVGHLDGSVRYVQPEEGTDYRYLFTVAGNDVGDEFLEGQEPGGIDEQLRDEFFIDHEDVLDVVTQLENGDADEVMEAYWKFAVNEERFEGSSGRDGSVNNMKSILLAWHSHHDLYQVFPPDIATPDKKAGLSWRVRILPLLDEQELFEQFRFDEPWDSEHNRALIAKMPDVFSDPTTKLPAGMTRYVSVRGEGTVFEDRVELADVSDGTSLTGALVEAKKPVPWTKPEDVTLGEDFESLLLTFAYSYYRIGLCDGAVRYFPSQTFAQYQSLFDYDDGQPKVLRDVEDIPLTDDEDEISLTTLRYIGLDLLQKEDPFIQVVGTQLFWATRPRVPYARTDEMRAMINHETNAAKVMSESRISNLERLLFVEPYLFDFEINLVDAAESDPETLYAYMDSEDPDIRKRVLLLLEKVGTARFLPALEQIKNDPTNGALAQQAITAIQSRSADQPAELPEEQRQARLQERDQLWDESQKLIQEGKSAEGIAKVEEMLKIEQQVFGEFHDIPLQTNDWIIDNARSASLYDVSVRQQQNRVEMLKKKHGSDHTQVSIDQGLVDTYEKEAQFTPEQMQKYNDQFAKDGQVKELIQQEKLQEAIQLLAEIIDARRELVGRDSVMIVANMRQLRQLLFQTEQHQRAFEVAQELTRVSGLIFGDQSPVVQSDRSEMIYLQQFAGNPEGVVEQLMELQKIPEDKLKIDTAAQDSRFIGLRLSEAGRVEESVFYLKRAYDLYDQLQNQDRAGEIANLIGDQYLNSDPTESAAWYTDSVWRYRKVNPFQGYYANYPSLAEMMRTSGKLHLEMSIRKALVDALRQGTSSEKVGLLNFVKTLPPLADTYIRLGDYEMAERVLRECAQVTGDYRDDPFVIDMLIQQAVVNDYFGAEEVAQQLYEQALEQSKKSTEPFLAEMPKALRELGKFHLRHNRLEEATVYVDTAADLLSLKENADYAAILALKAQIQLKKQELDEALQTLTTGAALLNSGSFSSSEQLDLHLSYAEHWLTAAKFDEAQAHATAALNLAAQQQGEDSLPYCQALETVAQIEFARDDRQAALATALEALEKTRTLVEQSAYLLSPRQQLLYADTMRRSLDLFLTIAVEDPANAPVCFDQILKWKGAGLVRQRTINQRAEQANVAPFYEQLNLITSQLASLSTSSAAGQTEDLQQLDRLSEVKDLLEGQLSAARLAYMDMQEPITVEQFVAALPREGVFVDYYVYRPQSSVNAEAAGPVVLTSIIKPTGEVQVLPLDRLERVQEALILWRSGLGATDDSRKAGSLLREILWDPLLPVVGQTELVLISPDNILAQIPFQALPTPAGDRYLIEVYKLGLIPVPQLLPELIKPAEETTPGEMLLVGAVRYDLESNAAASSSVTTRSLHKGTNFTPLPGTGEEILAISELFAATHPQLTGEQLQQLADDTATERAFREALTNFKQIHIATHGYFIERDEQLMGSEDSVRRFNPGLMSGLAFAGANNRDHAVEEDGLLTAAEIATLNMEHVELAVLSACETGLGEVAEGEGLIGIQRSFQVAGTGATVASLWQVPDQATRVLMERFYRNYWEKKMSRLDALREAQLFLLNTPEAITNPALVRGDRRVRPQNTPPATSKRLDPESWAAFVLSGDWR